MRLSPARRVALRLGAVFAAIGAVVLIGFAVTIDSSPTGPDEITAVPDPSAIALPAPGLFGSTVTVYGAGDASASSLGCRLLDRSGHEQSRAKLSDLGALSEDDVTVEGATLTPIFVVRSYPSGATLECAQATDQDQLALSAPSTFGANALLVRVVAGAGAALCLVVALIGFVITRRQT